jgi:hypothetical protein
MTNPNKKKNTSLSPDSRSCGSSFAVLLTILLFFIGAVDINAANWTQVKRDPGGTYRAVCYGSGLFVAVGDAGLISTSSDGSSWTNRTSGTSYNLYDVTYGGGLYVAVGYHGIILTSSNGSSWTTREPYTSAGLSFTSVAYNGTDLYVAGGVSGRLATSPDAITWTDRNSGLDIQLSDMAYGNGKFIAAGSSGKIPYSSDGINWTNKSVTGVNNYSAIYAGGIFMVGGQNGRVYTSANGTTWTKQSSGTTNYFMGITHNGSKFIASGNSDGYTCSMALVSNAGGTSWVRDKTPDYSSLLGCAAGGGVIVAVGTRRLIIRNTDAGIGDGVGCGSTPPPPPSGDTITVTSPNGGESWAASSTQTITWKGSKKYTTIDLEYFNGSSWVKIVSGIADSGSYSWKIPNTQTTLAKVWIKGNHSGGNAVDRSDDTFKITSPGTAAPEIVITSPKGGDSLSAGSTKAITWTTGGAGTIETVEIQYTVDGSNYVVLTDNAPNTGSYNWTVPSTITSQARIWIKGYGTEGNDIDFSDYFSIVGGLTVTSPNGGESWSAGESRNITWDSIGNVGNVKIELSTNSGGSYETLVASTANDGSHPWNVSNAVSDNCLIRITEVSGNKASDVSNKVFSIGGTPELDVDKSKLSFGAVKNGSTPSSQSIIISNAGGGTLQWSIASSDSSWLKTSHTSGSGDAAIGVSVDISTLNVGSYTGNLTISDTAGDSGPVDVTVKVNVINSNQDKPPFGSFATPADGTSVVSGSIAVTGWALDDVEVASVQIYRVVNGGDSYIGDAVFVEGSRPDVEQAYPDYPLNSRAGWGYMLLTNFLPEGTLVLKVIVRDITGYQVVLGENTVIVDNTNATKPFGALDSPGQGGEASGSNFRCNGWALTPQPKTIPFNGSTIDVYVDGVAIGKATYNLYREDIANFFPGYNNTNGSWAYFDLNTNAYSNGIHTIQFSVRDDAGSSDGIGSRYFIVKNVETDGTSAARPSAGLPGSTLPKPQILPDGLSRLKLERGLAGIHDDFSRPVHMKTGYTDNGMDTEIYPDENGMLSVDMNELGRIKLTIDGMPSPNKRYAGFLKVGETLRPLPVGSTMDQLNGVFYWLAGPGFVGQYDLVFVITENGVTMKKEIRVNIMPGNSLELNNR